MLVPRIMIGLALLFVPAMHAVGVGDAAPSLSFGKTWNTTSSPASLQALQGKTVFVEVFATW